MSHKSYCSTGNIPIICSCGRKARKGQRTCAVCHAAKMKAYRQAQINNTIAGYADPKGVNEFRCGKTKALVITSTPVTHHHVLVKIILCKNRKKQ